MDSQPSKKCAVCDETAHLRCGACQVVRFCSPRCQRILWPAHKALCGRATETFYLPPLTPDDVQQLERIKDRAYPPHDPSFTAFLARFAGLSWQEFLDIVTSSGSDDFDTAGLRSHLLTAAFCHLGQVANDVRHETGKVAPLPAWHTFGTAAVDMVHAYIASVDSVDDAVSSHEPHAVSCSGLEPWLVLNGVLRQQLVGAAVSAAVTAKNPLLMPLEGARLKIVSQKRVLDELERAAVPQIAKEHIGAMVKEEIAKTEQAVTMGCAVS